jgi:molybdate transport system permease protein
LISTITAKSSACSDPLLEPEALQALWLTAKVSAVVTLILLLIGTPIAWWLARTQSRLKAPIAALVALPLVLPPTVLGFYLLLAMGPNGFAGRLYSLPFMVQPLQHAFEAIGRRPLEVAATLRATPLDAFFSVVVPMALPGFLTASVMSFAHTVGEFGVVLMIGGNLAGETRVASVQIYDYVEAMQYEHAHAMAAVLIGFSFIVLLVLHVTRPRASSAQ